MEVVVVGVVVGVDPIKSNSKIDCCIALVYYAEYQWQVQVIVYLKINYTHSKSTEYLSIGVIISDDLSIIKYTQRSP